MSNSIITYASVEEFQQEGYLQEVNRTFLHPLGLALEVRSGYIREGVKALLESNGVGFGEDAVDNIMTFIRLAGLDQMHIGGLWEARDDPEGWVFNSPGPDADKARHIQELWRQRHPARMERLGYMVQPYKEQAQ